MFPTIVQSHDDELRQHVAEFLASRGLRWKRLQVTVSSGVVVVDGRATSERDKRLCLECCRHVAGVVRVIDQIQVAHTSGEAATTAQITITIYDGSLE